MGLLILLWLTNYYYITRPPFFYVHGFLKLNDFADLQMAQNGVDGGKAGDTTDK